MSSVPQAHFQKPSVSTISIFRLRRWSQPKREQLQPLQQRPPSCLGSQVAIERRFFESLSTDQRDWLKAKRHFSLKDVDAGWGRCFSTSKFAPTDFSLVFSGF
jgi:hypothetical protein